MKNGLILALLVVLLSLPAIAQEPAAGSFMLGVGAETAVPMGDFSDVSNFGIGGMASGHYLVDPNLTLSVKVGFIRFSGKDVSVYEPFTGTTITVSGGSLNCIPITVGGRYYFMPPADMRVYGAADVGIFMLSNGDSESKFGAAPVLGAMFKAGENLNVDVHASYQSVFTEGSTTSWVGAGIGLVFALPQ